MKFVAVLAVALSVFSLPVASAATNTCKAGTYFSGGTCKPATIGHYVPNNGATEQLPCPLGTYSPSAWRQKCESCSKGFHAAKTGLGACAGAQPGYMVATDGASAQTPCPVGSYMSAPAANYCEKCAAGYTTAAAASYLPSACKAIMYDSLQEYYAVHGDARKAHGVIFQKPWKCQDGKNWKKSIQGCK